MVIPEEAGIQETRFTRWIPVFAGMTASWGLNRPIQVFRTSFEASDGWLPKELFDFTGKIQRAGYADQILGLG